MAATMIPTQPIPIPPDLKKELPDPYTPWRISPEIFSTMTAQTGAAYKKVEVLPGTPEWRFIWRYFQHDKPHRYNIQRAYCIFERHQQRAFEESFSNIEREADAFPPTWSKELRAAQRTEAIERWKNTTQVFSPFTTTEPDGRQRSWKKVKVLPLWHGSNETVCDSVAKLGFVYFGKTSITPGEAGPKSTDVGYFGSGIYFSNSARYTADVYSRGHLLLSWVSMREPFPVVGDPTQSDMDALKGKGAYKDYNAHYIPIRSIDPTDPFECEYFPCLEGALPHCDEYVVFNKTQTLPRFWITLEVSLPQSLATLPQTIGELKVYLLTLLEHLEIDKDQRLRKHLEQTLKAVLQLPEENYLDEHGDCFTSLLENLSRLIVDGKMSRDVSKAITTAGPSTSGVTTPRATNLSPKVTPSQPVISPQAPKVSPQKSATTSPIPTSLTPEGWTHPAELLEKMRPHMPQALKDFLKGKNEKDFIIAPRFKYRSDGMPLNVPALHQLDKDTGGPGCGDIWGPIKKLQAPDKDLEWLVMTKGVLDGSRNQKYVDQEKIAQRQGYEVPSVQDATYLALWEYRLTGKSSFSDNPETYTRCRENIHGLKLIVGGFGPAGLSVYCYDDFDHAHMGVAGLRKFF